MNLQPVKEPKNITLHMLRGDMQRVSDYPRGTTIVCENGELWLTQSGDPVDHVLEPGERYTLSPHGKVIIEAMRPASLRIITPN